MWNGLYGMGVGTGAAVLYTLPHSRKQESEADRIGLTYMARAGYDPAAAIAFWQRFAEYNKARGGETPWFLRTHPLDETRIRQIEDWIPEVRSEVQLGVQP